ncbi:endolytic transglycosylase MltG [Nonomuraea sp. NPDC046802]|uniref:endolytic transglycosylase MltG n=1 Tax=Nonomuraea sp. NPDC046802 TaxID=3154919 RepID=UPI0033D624D2
MAEFERAAKDVTALGLPSYAKGRLEGFVAPGAYDFSPVASPGEILKAMVTRTAAGTALVDDAGRAGRTPLEIVTIASIVQAEARRDEDMPKIARVIHNRLNRKMRLKVESTLLYGLNKYGVSTPEDLKSPSPYNTYRHSGLPPGPIGSPGDAAMRAALKPASGPWLYYVTTDPKGTTKFATSPSDFEKLLEEYKKNTTRR